MRLKEVWGRRAAVGNGIPFHPLFLFVSRDGGEEGEMGDGPDPDHHRTMTISVSDHMRGWRRWSPSHTQG